MRDIIDVLLPDVEPKKSYGTVVKPLSNNRYQIRDNQRRLSVVDATDKWHPGDGVAIARGLIIGAAAISDNPKIYEV